MAPSRSATSALPEILETASKMSAFDEAARLDHITLHGDIFRLPEFRMKEIFDAIPPHCFKPSTLRSMAYVVRDFFYWGVLVYSTTFIKLVTPEVLDSLTTTYTSLTPDATQLTLLASTVRFLLWTLYTTLAGLVFTGIWILAHECGHGAFSRSKTLNYTMGLIMHSFLLVPFHSWRLSHSAHHKATGNLAKDTAFVPHTRESWLKTYKGKENVEKKGTGHVDFAHLAEDSPIVTLWNCLVHQLVGFPGYLLFNLTGQSYDVKFPKQSHFWFGVESPLYKKNELGYILLSDVGILAMCLGLWVAGRVLGSWEVIVLWGVPWLWVNHWIVAITFLQHTDASLPHYSAGVWRFECGASATIDRDLGFIDTHLFHDIIGTHVCHHLISSIPFYHAGEASVHIKRVMGDSYKKAADETRGVVGFHKQFWKMQRECKFVEESEGAQGKGVFMYRNLHGVGVRPLDLTGGKDGDVEEEEGRDVVPAVPVAIPEGKVVSGMASGPMENVKRRLSQGHSLPASLPLLAE